MNAHDFLLSLYGDAASGWLTVWTMPDKKTMYFSAGDISTAVQYADELAPTHDIYYGVGLRREKLGEHQRGGNEDVSVLPAFWSDIDIAGPAHKETALPGDIDAALKFMNSLPLPPSMVVCSGNGLHVYWQFSEPLTIATEAHRMNIAGALRGWQTYINEAAKDCGWKLDNTSDLARVLRLPGSINHKKCIKTYGAKHRKAAAVEEELLLDGIDLGGAVIPRKWQITEESGVRRAFSLRDTDGGEIVACPDPVVITRRLTNIDDGKERLELSFRRDGKWKTLVGGRAQIYNKTSIIAFGDEGLHVTSGTASELVSYLSDYETANKGKIPLVRSISRLGWIDDGAQFFPYSVKDEILFEEDKGTAVLFRNLAERGDYQTWRTMMAELRKNDVARFITSASFASPLLFKIGVRTFVMHLWHMSASGKSAALKAAISVWGNPLRIMGNGFTTVVGTEQLAGTLRNLPFGIDEKQSADERKLSLEHLIYVLGQGSGKIRGARGGGNAEVAMWHNIVMLTGEEPVTRSSSLDGIQTRTFEIYGKPVDDMDFAKNVHIVSENNYGFAGAAFMRAVCAKQDADPTFLRREYLSISEELKGKGLGNIHADYVAAVALGDILAETLIFGTEDKAARIGALRCGEVVYALNEEQMSGDVIERAWDFIMGWLISNEHRFDAAASPFYGKMEPSPGGRYHEYFVIPQYLDAALEDTGFNVKKTFQGLRDRRLVTTQTDSEGFERTKINARVFGKQVRVYQFRIKSEQIQPLTGRNDIDS